MKILLMAIALLLPLYNETAGLALAAISPNDIHESESSGDVLDGWALLMVGSWFACVMAALWIANACHLSYRQSLKLWALFNAVPVLLVVVFRPVYPSTLVGMVVIVGFSWAIGRAIFDHREGERRKIQQLVDDGLVDPAHVPPERRTQ